MRHGAATMSLFHRVLSFAMACASPHLRATLGILSGNICKTCPSHLSPRFLISRSILSAPSLLAQVRIPNQKKFLHIRLQIRFSRLFQVTLPVYLNQTRTELLFTLDMATRGEAAGREHRFYERGVAFLASSLSGWHLVINTWPGSPFLSRFEMKQIRLF